MKIQRYLTHWRTVLISTLLGMAAQTAIADSTASFTDEEIAKILKMSPLDPAKLLDPTNAYRGNKAAIKFGKTLFFDRRLSSNGSESCAACHNPKTGWAGGNELERDSHKVDRRTPALWNVAYYRWYNWDGSADSLWAQALGPLESEKELANTRVGIARTIQQEEDLRTAYETLFGKIPSKIATQQLPTFGRPVPQDKDHPHHRNWLSLSSDQRKAINHLFVNVGKAIAAFEATIVSANAPFDRFVEGLRTSDPLKLEAIPQEAKRGLKLFLGKGQCVLCHSGPNFSDGEFHHVFLGDKSNQDLGRWNGINRLRQSEFNSLSTFNDAKSGQAVNWVEYVVRSPETKHRFKTPTLRNLVGRASYMHTGQFDTLEQVMDHYSGIAERLDEEERHIELVLTSLKLTEVEKRDLIAFLRSLTDVKSSDQFGAIAQR